MSLRIPPLAQFVACALLSWVLTAYFPKLGLAWSGLVYLAAAFMSLGLVILTISVAAFIHARTTVNPMAPEQAQHLVTSGLYRYSRNPMYLGLLCALLGAALYLENLAAFLGPVLFVWLMTELQIKPEERALQLKFGDAFTDYRQKTRRWI
ncbi:MAG: isoprenylcysteine carboxylmethyltransferase family protein [Henriciella sp.]|jgi:protein-S-isoprenylcysteine O-methyltransferase Ste14